MSYLIITKREPRLTIDPSSFENQLQAQWPEITFVDTDPFSLLAWTVPIIGDVLYGFLHNDKATVSLDSYDESVAAFAVWYRSVIPGQYQLTLCHDQLPEMMIELQPGDTQEDILNKLTGM
jgi:hypothetical protein